MCRFSQSDLDVMMIARMPPRFKRDPYPFVSYFLASSPFRICHASQQVCIPVITEPASQRYQPMTWAPRPVKISMARNFPVKFYFTARAVSSKRKLHLCRNWHCMLLYQNNFFTKFHFWCSQLYFY